MLNFLWKYPTLSTEKLTEKSNKFISIYNIDISGDLMEKINHLKSIKPANIKNNLSPLNILNIQEKQKLKNIFPNICIALRLFYMLPVIVAEAKRSFNTLGRVKNFFRSTTAQDRLSSLGTLAMELVLTKQLDYVNIIDTFANEKSKKSL